MEQTRRKRKENEKSSSGDEQEDHFRGFPTPSQLPELYKLPEDIPTMPTLESHSDAPVAEQSAGEDAVNNQGDGRENGENKTEDQSVVDDKENDPPVHDPEHEAAVQFLLKKRRHSGAFPHTKTSEHDKARSPEGRSPPMKRSKTGLIVDTSVQSAKEMAKKNNDAWNDTSKDHPSKKKQSPTVTRKPDHAEREFDPEDIARAKEESLESQKLAEKQARIESENKVKKATAVKKQRNIGPRNKPLATASDKAVGMGKKPTINKKPPRPTQKFSYNKAVAKKEDFDDTSDDDSECLMLHTVPAEQATAFVAGLRNITGQCKRHVTMRTKDLQESLATADQQTHTILTDMSSRINNLESQSVANGQAIQENGTGIERSLDLGQSNANELEAINRSLMDIHADVYLCRQLCMDIKSFLNNKCPHECDKKPPAKPIKRPDRDNDDTETEDEDDTHVSRRNNKSSKNIYRPTTHVTINNRTVTDNRAGNTSGRRAVPMAPVAGGKIKQSPIVPANKQGSNSVSRLARQMLDGIDEKNKKSEQQEKARNACRKIIELRHDAGFAQSAAHKRLVSIASTIELLNEDDRQLFLGIAPVEDNKENNGSVKEKGNKKKVLSVLNNNKTPSKTALRIENPYSSKKKESPTHRMTAVQAAKELRRLATQPGFIGSAHQKELLKVANSVKRTVESPMADPLQGAGATLDFNSKEDDDDGDEIEV